MRGLVNEPGEDANDFDEDEGDGWRRGRLADVERNKSSMMFSLAKSSFIGYTSFASSHLFACDGTEKIVPNC